MSSSWEEIRRLAGDLQRAQLGEAAKKLSERNCVEIVGKLTERGLVSLIYTVDGKEYLTRQHLATEIKNEVAAAGGRLGLVELAQALCVDYRVVEEAAANITKSDPNFTLAVGQLISRDYLDSLCREVGAKLESEGRVYLADLTKHYDLPTELTASVIKPAVGTLIKGIVDREDPGLIYTESFIQTQKAVVRGTMSALTKVTVLNPVVKAVDIPSELFFRLLDELIAEGEVKGVLSGGRNLDRAVWIPHLFHLMLHSYTSSYYADNGYIDLTALKKLGVSEAREHIVSALGKKEADSLIFLSTIAIGPSTWADIIAKAEEELKWAGHAEVGSLLPPVSSVTDSDSTAAAALLAKQRSDYHICASEPALLFTGALREKASSALEPIVAEKAAKEGPRLLKELQAAKHRPAASPPDDDDDWDTGKDAFSVRNDFAGKEVPEPIVEEIAEELLPQLNTAFRAKVESVFLERESATLGAQKRSHGDFRETATRLLRSIAVFDEGADRLPDSTAAQLKGHLLRTLCTEVANLSLGYVSGSSSDLSSAKSVDSTIAGLQSPHAREAFKALYASLSGKKEDLGEFWAAIDVIAAPDLAGLSVRTPDKRLRQEIVSAHGNSLESELESCEEAARGLLLALLILFAREEKDAAVHASGKFVPALVSQLLPKVEDEELRWAITTTQTEVVASMKAKADTDDLHPAYQRLKNALLSQKAS